MPIDFSKMRKTGDPRTELSVEELKALQEFSEQHQKLRDARLNVLDAWNALDNDLVSLLGTIVGTTDPIIASALYFTPHTFRTRLDIIGKIVSHFVTNGMKDPSLLMDWQKLSKKLGEKRQVRNWASHGHIITYVDPNGKNHALLAPVLTQMDKYTESFQDGRKPGATLRDVEDAIDKAIRLGDEVRTYHSRIK